MIECIQFRRDLMAEQLSQASVAIQLMENRFFNFLRRAMGIKNKVHDPIAESAEDPAVLARLRIGRILDDLSGEASEGRHDLERDARHAPADAGHDAADDFVCVRFADGSTRSGLIGSSERLVVSPRK